MGYSAPEWYSWLVFGGKMGYSAPRMVLLVSVWGQNGAFCPRKVLLVSVWGQKGHFRPRSGYLLKFRGQIKKTDFQKSAFFRVFGWVIISPLRSLRRLLHRLSGQRLGLRPVEDRHLDWHLLPELLWPYLLKLHAMRC